MKMSDIEEFEYINKLYELYKNLLTPRQIEIMDKYYLYNLSLSEISDILHISRTAISDALNHAKNNLFEYENKLKLNEKYSNLNKLLDKENLDEEIKEKIFKELY